MTPGERTRAWNKKNPARKKQTDGARYAKFKAEGRVDEYYGNVDVELGKKRAKSWRETNRGRVNANIAKRRAVKLQATPSWTEFDKINSLYKQARHMTETTGINYQVDHIIPLKSDVVCGLHCINNLQILTADENNRKKCKTGETKWLML
jgi:hypothetical protein